MGAGKTTFARDLDPEALDADREIERRAGRSIAEIFAEQGEEGFRRIEEETVVDLLRQAAEAGPGERGLGRVVSLGGGAVLSAAVREALRSCVTVWLDIEVEVAWRRSGSGEGDRPLARDREGFERLFQERRGIYADLADAVIPTLGLGEPGGPRRSAQSARIREALATLAQLPAGSRLLWAQSRGGSYPVYAGPGLAGGNGFRPGERWPVRGRPFFVTDTNLELVMGGPGGLLADLGEMSQVLPPGETAKTLANAEAVIRAMVEAGCSRADHVVAVGGGVVGDLAGFCAAVYQRGVPVVQVPTSVVAQVDSAYGGKTGVDLPGAKNYVGAYHQPAAVIADTELLETLPTAELAAGFVEVIKTGLLAGGRLWQAVLDTEPGSAAAVARHPFLVFDCARYKCGVVAADERDGGLRQVLNLGHTVGHAIEAATDYRAYRHGEAVGLGLLAALRLSEADELRATVAELLRAWQLPVKLRPGETSPGAVAALIRRDKKRLEGDTPFVLLPEVGEPRYGQKLAAERVLAAIEELFG